MDRKSLMTVAAGVLAVLAAGSASAKLDKSYYGTNYTVPFAHAYRALNELGVDHKQAIDRDTYHMSRLGLNAFRLHLWDVELSDSTGNLLDNEHLELLDYLIAACEKRGIKVMLTAQTNFGNGYPEVNTDPNGAFTYDYDKCRIHETPEAVEAQERYISQLVNHRNRYNGMTYAGDPDIIMMEINNEPCHSGSAEEITAYVNRMVKALRDSGWEKDILYNVSHNLDRTSGFYNADIDGTTYQWYPTGLVHGSQRHGNFLPALDDYHIPFDTVAGYGRQPRIVYEYDPGDVLDTYLYPAAARTFRKAGFDWITQFAYDPIDMARFNSEYQTHFLNLAYTPGKAVGMAIAAEVARRVPKGKDYGKFPVDTVFGDFLVSANRNLAMLNDGEMYYHTSNTTEHPKNLKKLRHIIGVGTSPVVRTDGTGAYFIDRLDRNVWRLELMPDVVLTDDPFKRPSLNRSVAYVSDSAVNMTIDLPGLADDYAFKGVAESYEQGKAVGHSVSLKPGVYLMGNNASELARWDVSDKYGDGNRLVGEYVMPPVADTPAAVVNHTPVRIAKGAPVVIDATVVASAPIDSVLIYPSYVNFWRTDNEVIPMRKNGRYGYTATLNPQHKTDRGKFDYNIVVYSGGRAVTYPSREEGAPLDWDFAAGRETGRPLSYYNLEISESGAPVVLYDARHGYDATDMERTGFSKYVGDIMASHQDISGDRQIKITVAPTGKKEMVVLGLVTRDGFTYGATVQVSEEGVGTVNPDELKLTDTYLFPEPFPGFISRTFKPEESTAVPFDLKRMESLTVSTPGRKVPMEIKVETITME